MNSAAAVGLGKRKALFPEQRLIVHAAFLDLNVETDITKSGLLKFSTIDACAKKNAKLKNVMDALLKTKHNMTLVKCSIQSSLGQRTKEMLKEAQSKKVKARAESVVPAKALIVGNDISHSSKHAFKQGLITSSTPVTTRSKTYHRILRTRIAF